MYFQSWAEFWAMGGYGLFVWLSFGSSYVMLAALAWYSQYQHKQFKRQLSAKLAREKRLQQYQEQAH
ncbi:heme exporter protein CcmD [Rheinheimera pacifica]|uniref:Heme exporter protein D n=1 Tax=Rheinheimera pacifica TaxID=173990 RepID=A0A1H6MJH1_9GAMM|nr:heme exporter protein CcmD [Rheinheimera pacifica]MDR6983980.1 heme exporter protein D [Rheinheimera pacifica]PKM17326.1 MAG: heme exporter protein CcmD [Gammaproteobacteria bacterium HGW-Gammaproteobacteria-15]SEH99349.1 heme exporter protein D [Rheinheimera pacifica]